MCFLWDTWSCHTPFLNYSAFYIKGWCNIKHHFHTWARGCPWLANVAIDRREKVCPSHSESTASDVLCDHVDANLCTRENDNVIMYGTSNKSKLKNGKENDRKLELCAVHAERPSLSVMVVSSSCTASMSLASLVRYWHRRSSCCRAMAMRLDRLCMQLITEGSALACRGQQRDKYGRGSVREVKRKSLEKWPKRPNSRRNLVYSYRSCTLTSRIIAIVHENNKKWTNTRIETQRKVLHELTDTDNWLVLLW